jgi:hypothetical protein
MAENRARLSLRGKDLKTYTCQQEILKTYTCQQEIFLWLNREHFAAFLTRRCQQQIFLRLNREHFAAFLTRTGVKVVASGSLNYLFSLPYVSNRQWLSWVQFGVKCGGGWHCLKSLATIPFNGKGGGAKPCLRMTEMTARLPIQFTNMRRQPLPAEWPSPRSLITTKYRNQCCGSMTFLVWIRIRIWIRGSMPLSL